MTYIPVTLRQAREALLQSAAALHVIAQSLEGADEPASAPEAPPDVVDSREVEPQPDASPEPNESPVRRWIIDRPPTEEDDWVAIPARPGTDRSGFWEVAWCYAYPGTPWAPVDAIPDKPFDPTCLDRNGWIRSRLPEAGDIDDEGEVIIPVLDTDDTECCLWVWMKAAYIVPGQPWAPVGSHPGEYQP